MEIAKTKEITTIKMIIQNVRGILTNDEENTEVKEEVVNELSKFN